MSTAACERHDVLDDVQFVHERRLKMPVNCFAVTLVSHGRQRRSVRNDCTPNRAIPTEYSRSFVGVSTAGSRSLDIMHPASQPVTSVACRSLLSCLPFGRRLCSPEA